MINVGLLLCRMGLHKWAYGRETMKGKNGKLRIKYKDLFCVRCGTEWRRR